MVFTVFAEGTKELRPTSASGGMLNPWDWGGEFATYDAAPEDRMYFTIHDHLSEQVYLGFNAKYGGETYMRIKDQNGNIVFGPVELKKFGNPGYIVDHAEAVAGPVQFNSQGYTPLVFSPTSNGDYYIELNRDSAHVKQVPPVGFSGGYRYSHFDVTVVNTVLNKKVPGRLWAYKWALTSGSGGIPFDAKMYVLRQDSIRFEVDYNGIDPYGFGIVSNSFGIDSSGNYLEDRKSNDSLYTQGTVPYKPRHRIFVNPPDPTAYPYPTVQPSVNLSIFGQDVITGCILTGYCFNLKVTKEGQVAVTLDLDQNPGYQSGGRDVILFSRVFQGNNCIAWNGLDGYGDTARSANISVDIHYQAGLIHIPIYDAEAHPNGYVFSLYKGPGQKDTLALYWDDSNFSNKVNLTGCTTLPCRDYTNNYGNERFINTWSAAFDQRMTFNNIRFEFCPPEAIDDSATVYEGKKVNINTLVNDIVVLTQLDVSSLTLKSGPSNGTLTLDTVNGIFTYKPNFGFKGVDTFCYMICDTFTMARCDSALVFITVLDANLQPDVLSVNGLPVSGDTSVAVTVYEDSVLNVCLGWIEYDGDSLYVSGLFSGPSHGSLAGVFDGDSCFSYTPSLNYYGPDTLVIEICDDQVPSMCDTLWVPINVLPVNDAPVITSANGINAVNDTIKTLVVNEDDTLHICLGNNDVENDTGDVVLAVYPPAHGSLLGMNSGDSCFTYVPSLNYNGGDTLTIIYCDNGTPSGCDTTTIIIDVLPINDPPVANYDISAVNPGDSVQKRILLNDYDLESKNLTFTIVSGPKYGTMKIIGDTVRYISDPLYPYVLDTIVYSVCDTGMPVLCTQGYYFISVPKNNYAPEAKNDTATTLEDVPVTIGILANDFDPNYDPMTFVVFTNPHNGQVANVNNKLVYTPNPNFFGKDSLQYEVCDTTAPVQLCDTAWVYITTVSQPDKPSIEDSLGNPIGTDTLVMYEDATLSICLNVTDGDGDVVDVSQAILLNNNATVTGLNDGDTCFVYQPMANYNGLDSLYAIVCDNSSPSLCDSILLYINVLPVNDAPYAMNDTAMVILNSLQFIDIHINDNDSIDGTDFDSTSFNLLTAASHGTVIYTKGQIMYTPSHGFVGLDSLQYEICDSGLPLPGLCASAWVYLSVDASNNPPIAVNDTFTMFSNSLDRIKVLKNDYDPDGQGLSISILTHPFSGTASVTDSTISYTSALSFCGLDSLQYQICDNAVVSKCDTAWVFIYVHPSDSDQDSLSDNFETLTRNTDGDLKNDYQDVDSDNDGIYDMTEAAPIYDICNPTVMDFDGDGTPDYRDEDSDNDGIPDFVERSKIIIAPSGQDADGDGIDDAYDSDFGGYLESNPVDTDGDGFPDFRDLDSDNDGRTDTEEMGGNPNKPVDTDGDGIPDFRDIDSDNDGILDKNESDDDCNDNGIPDWLDPSTCDLFVPQGISPDGDGVNDFLVIPQISSYPNNSIMIFNRWGNKVYAKAPYDNTWEGTASEAGVINGNKALPAGTYFYVLDLGDSTKPLTGYIYLKR